MSRKVAQSEQIRNATPRFNLEKGIQRLGARVFSLLSGNAHYGIPQQVCQSVPWLEYKSEYLLFWVGEPAFTHFLQHLERIVEEWMDSLCSPADTSDPNQSPGKYTLLIVRDLSWENKDRLIYPFLPLEKPMRLLAVWRWVYVSVTRTRLFVTRRMAAFIGGCRQNTFVPIHISLPRLLTSGKCPKNACWEMCVESCKESVIHGGICTPLAPTLSSEPCWPVLDLTQSEIPSRQRRSLQRISYQLQKHLSFALTKSLAHLRVFI